MNNHSLACCAFIYNKNRNIIGIVCFLLVRGHVAGATQPKKKNWKKCCREGRRTIEFQREHPLDVNEIILVTHRIIKTTALNIFTYNATRFLQPMVPDDFLSRKGKNFH